MVSLIGWIVGQKCAVFDDYLNMLNEGNNSCHICIQICPWLMRMECLKKIRINWKLHQLSTYLPGIARNMYMTYHTTINYLLYMKLFLSLFLQKYVKENVTSRIQKSKITILSLCILSTSALFPNNLWQFFQIEFEYSFYIWWLYR